MRAAEGDRREMRTSARGRLGLVSAAKREPGALLEPFGNARPTVCTEAPCGLAPAVDDVSYESLGMLTAVSQLAPHVLGWR